MPSKKEKKKTKTEIHGSYTIKQKGKKKKKPNTYITT